MSRRSVIVLLAVLLVASNLAWAYVALDTGVTATHAQDAVGSLEASSETLRALASRAVAGLTPGEAQALLAELDPASEPFVKAGADGAPESVTGGGVTLTVGPDGRIRGVAD